MPNVLTIAGSDTLSGGGLQADLKTFEIFDTFGLSVITSVATLTTQQAFSIHSLPSAIILEQLNAILTQVPLTHLKIGLVNNAQTLTAVVDLLAQYPALTIVVDPVLAFKEGHTTIDPDYLAVLKNELLPLATLVTPNLPEAAILSHQPTLATQADLESAATTIQAYGVQNVVIKGGQRLNQPLALDLLKTPSQSMTFKAPLLPTTTINGAGCTFSAAITAGLAQGLTIQSAVAVAKKFVYRGIQAGIQFENGTGSVRQIHDFDFRKELKQ